MKNKLEYVGVVKNAYKGCMFDVIYGSDKQNVFASISGKMRKLFIKVVPGDRVKIEVSQYDPTKGRIVQRIN